jgi:hypothetical protein
MLHSVEDDRADRAARIAQNEAQIGLLRGEIGQTEARGASSQFLRRIAARLAIENELLTAWLSRSSEPGG